MVGLDARGGAAAEPVGREDLPVTSDRSAGVIGAMFVSAGVAHFVRPAFFEAIIPAWVPNAPLVNKVAGAAEMVLGAAMIPRSTRPAAARGLLVLLVAVFPANVDMAIHDVDVRPDEHGELQRVEDAGTGPRNWIRLPFQFLIMRWVSSHMRRLPTVQPKTAAPRVAQ